MDAPILQLRELTKYYGAQAAVRGVGFSVAPGMIAGLLGPNGAGKTTILRMLSGLIDPTSGEARIAGRVQSTANRDLRREVGLVSADCPFYEELTARESLVLHAVLHGLSGSRAAVRIGELSALCGLDGMLNRRMGELSTGMIQRVRIARAMLHAPRVLLLDEPTTGLDPDVRRAIWEVLRTLAGSGVCILMSTHNLHEAAELCGEIHVLHRGALAGTQRRGEDGFTAESIEAAYLSACTEAARA